MVLVVALGVLLGCPTPGYDPGGDDGDDGEGGGPDPVPEIALTYDGFIISNGGIASLGLTVVNTLRQVTFGIENHGTDALHLTGDPCITKSGSLADSITIVAEPASSISPGDSAFFTVQLTASLAGDLNVLLSIECNDPRSSPYTISVTATVIEPPAKTPKTGQTASYATGDDGDLELGVVWPTPRFVDNGDGTTTDTLTGLMWETTPATTTTDWEYALTYANNLTLGGYDDWHLANVNELMSLVNAGVANPATWLNSHSELSGIRSDDYWTSNRSYSASFTAYAWVVHFDTGVLARLGPPNFAKAYRWAVRYAGGGAVAIPKTGKVSGYRQGDDGYVQAGAAWPTPRFIDNEDGTVTDALTGLIWTQGPNTSTGTWQEALTYANELDYAGQTDWRLPSRSEMRSLISYETITNHYRLASGFSTTVPDGEYWTSSTYAPSTGQAWLVVIETGHSYYESKTAANNYMWAVRGGE
jgi:hypothetical protein